MDSDTAIRDALELGERHGLASLTGVQKLVFAISEAEVYCDKDGIDGLIDRYGVPAMCTFAEAFEAVGATEIATALLALTKDGPIPEALLARANTLITDRRGYAYDNLEALVNNSA
ncbi:CBS domain-containing protein [Variovorax boronicumulans]|uniref:hypothetical protein n=1 Tax=Variovorax boronicumulans TaxID=436515 RepID=UPI0027806D04|nr:hypothetical protein [Variovorax boronicumulans]MDQ0014215.1 CBS domain-containing protein [Variovorax boronicumulans]